MELHHTPTQEVTPRFVKVILERLQRPGVPRDAGGVPGRGSPRRRSRLSRGRARGIMTRLGWPRNRGGERRWPREKKIYEVGSPSCHVVLSSPSPLGVRGGCNH